MSDEPHAPESDPPDREAGDSPAGEPSREEKLAQIRARVAAMRAARGGTAPPAPAPQATLPADAPPATEGKPEAAAAESAPEAGQPEEGAELTREQKLAQIRARAEALRKGKSPAPSATAPTAAPAAGAKAVAGKPAAPAAAGVEVPVSSLNPGGRPGAAPVHAALEAFGTLNQSVELRGHTEENENIRKLLGGLGAYQNPLRSSAWQIDYRYYAEARRRLEAAGYTVAERDYLDRPLAGWSPAARGWTGVDS